MRCSVHDVELVELFTSAFCPWCEDGDTPSLQIGYIVFRNRPPGATEYVFQSRHDAECWRAHVGMDTFPVRKVVSDAPFTWKPSAGTAAGLTLAEGVYEVFSEKPADTSGRRVWLDG